MKILRVICSPRGRTSESYRLSETMIELLEKSQPSVEVVDRDIGGGDLPPLDESYALSQQLAVDVSQEGSASVSDALIGELESSDVVVIATPMHNYAAPATLKLWIDHVVRVRHTFNISPNGKIGLLRDRPVFVAVASGGRFSGEHVRQPDFLTPYLKAILGMIGLHDLRFFAVQGTAFGTDAVTVARATQDQMLRDHFQSFPSGQPTGQ
jgi:FMN-dependent NADH-azoreductase